MCKLEVGDELHVDENEPVLEAGLPAKLLDLFVLAVESQDLFACARASSRGFYLRATGLFLLIHLEVYGNY